MKLEKYIDKDKKRRKITLISISAIVLISVSLLLYKTFASFTESAEFPMMKGKVDYFGNSDVYFAFYKGNDKLDSMPLKDNSENLVFNYGECDNGASIVWDSKTWGPMVKNLSKSKTKCSLYFKEKSSIEICNKYGNDSALCYITKLGDNDYVNMAYDFAMANNVLDNNLRYIGSNPNNYIDIGDRDSEDKPILWRIIGIMNNMISLDNGENSESLIKIIRADSIGNYSWDSSASDINSGYGVNEWSEADLMKLLNPNTVYSETPTIGASLYWNSENGSCYFGPNNNTVNCNFTSIGLSDEARMKLSKVRWNTGTFETRDVSKWKVNEMYKAERSNNNGKACYDTSLSTCSDNVNRTTTWDGYLALMYPSDYGYALSVNNKNNCFNKLMSNWDSENCNENWLNTSNIQLFLTPCPNLGNNYDVFMEQGTTKLNTRSTMQPDVIRPVGYLKPSIKITGGTGEIGSPFILEM